MEAVTKVLIDADVMMMSKIHDRWRLSWGNSGKRGAWALLAVVGKRRNPGIASDSLALC